MVYNETLYRPASLSERLQAKFGDRAATAVFRATSNGNATNAENKAGTKAQTQSQAGEVLSFFGRVDDTRSADRAMPSKRRAVKAQSVHSEVRTRPDTASVKRNVRADARPASQARPAARPAQARSTARPAPQQRPAQARARRPEASPEITGTFARAYAVGEKTRRTAADISGAPRRRYAPGATPSGSLRRGRSNIPGSRHAVLKTGNEEAERGNVVDMIRNAFSDRHVAEHRVKKAPFPIGLVTLMGICAFMVMVILFSFAQIHEYNNNINNMKQTQADLIEQAEKLEVQLEDRDDIREIEQIAVEDIGMVSSDMVQSKFVSVAGSDRVEMMAPEAEEPEGGFSALLSVIGETFGKLGEYFG